MRSRLIILVAAILMGVFAAGLTARYLDSLQRGVAAEDEPIEVLVVQGDVQRGVTAQEMVEAGLIVHESIPRRYVADGAVSSVANLDGQVLSESLSRGEQITQARFKYPSQAGLAYSIPEDYVAVAISNNAVKGVAGLVRPGDHVVVVATFDPGPDGEALSKVLLPKVRVLAVGASMGAGQTGTGTVSTVGGGGLVGSQQGDDDQEITAASTITLALAPADVEKLVYAEENGTVWLGLLGSAETDVTATTGRTLQSVLSE